MSNMSPRSAWHTRLPATLKRPLTHVLALLAAAAALVWVAALLDNRPVNLPALPRTAVAPAKAAGAPPSPMGRGDSVVALSLSGGGMRAAAFAYGALSALADDSAGSDIFDDIGLLSSVSGGSMTAAYFGLHGRSAFTSFKSQVLLRDLERDLRVSLLSPPNLLRLLWGGMNDRNNLAQALHKEVFGQATFGQLMRPDGPEVWINASDLYNRTPFTFTAPMFAALCSDLSRVHVADAVAASMAVPLVFAPVVLQTHPQSCQAPLPAWARKGAKPANSDAALVDAAAQALRNYRDPKRMRYIKLVDGGITDNNGLSSLLIAHGTADHPWRPLPEAEAVKLKHMLFLIVDAGRPPTGDWGQRMDGPSGMDVALAAADTAIDSAARLGVDAMTRAVNQWRDRLVAYRCALGSRQLAKLVPDRSHWRCDDLQVFVGHVGFDALDPDRAEHMRNMPTRLVLPRSDIEAAIAAGRDAAMANEALRAYRRARDGNAAFTRPGASAPQAPQALSDSADLSRWGPA